MGGVGFNNSNVGSNNAAQKTENTNKTNENKVPDIKEKSTSGKADNLTVEGSAKGKVAPNLNIFHDDIPLLDDKKPLSGTEEKPKSGEKERRVTERKGTMTFTWGYGWQGYAPSDIHFKGEGHDFTFRGVRAYDRPSPFSFDTYFNPVKLSIPQYMMDLNYHFTDKFFVRLGQHHMKYVMDDNQMVNINGTIDPSADPVHAGTYNGEFIHVNDVVQKFEHTDGLNDVHVGVGMVQSIWESKNGKNAVSMVGAVTGGVVVPRSDVRLFNQGANHPFHPAGWSASASLGLRVDFLKYMFVEGNLNGGYIDLSDIYTTGHNDPNRASQKIEYLNKYIGVGANIPINTHKK
jgi:hypothetical protein